MAKRKLVSSIYGIMMDRTFSAKKLHPFIEDFDIDMSVAREQEFDNFNDSFTRKLKNDARPVDTRSTSLVSPADGKILAYADISNSWFIIKGYRFDVSSFLDNPALTQKYHDGALLIIRLAPMDYHRFHFPVSGKISSNKKLIVTIIQSTPFALG